VFSLSSGRSMSGHMAGQNGSVWVPNTSMMNASFTSATAMSPYGSPGIPPSGQGYAGNNSGKSRMHSSPMYPGQQRASPIGSVESHQHQGYGSYGYPSSGPSSALPQHSPRHHYSTFSPQLASPGAQSAYPSAPANGSMNHLRSASAQQYGSRRQGW
jgi:hypothetical protein